MRGKDEGRVLERRGMEGIEKEGIYARKNCKYGNIKQMREKQV